VLLLNLFLQCSKLGIYCFSTNFAEALLFLLKLIQMLIKKSQIQLIDTLKIYFKSLDDYKEIEFLQKQSPEIWSIGQMYEHLETTVNYFFFKYIKYCLEQRNGQEGGEKTAAGLNVFKYNGFPHT
jgi:hypothetical protein